MTVRELIEKLKKCDMDAPVLIGFSTQDVVSVVEGKDDDGYFVALSA